MRAPGLLALLLFLLPGLGYAQTRGVDVQVNEGKPIPSKTAIADVVPVGGIVHDVLGWSHVDPFCDLATNPNRQLSIPKEMAKLYLDVTQVGARNFVTLGFNNPACGQKASPGAAFPNTDRLRAEFAAYAVRVVETVPALAGLSIWAEFNGSFGGGYKGATKGWKDYCQLSNAVIAAVRRVNPTLPIAIGATVGYRVDTYFGNLFNAYGCDGANDPTIWLDVHPYLTGAAVPGGSESDWHAWNASVARLRGAGINNLFFASESGGAAYERWIADNPGGDYLALFDAEIVTPKPADWAGILWFELLTDQRNPGVELFSRVTHALTPLGIMYQSRYNPG